MDTNGMKYLIVMVFASILAFACRPLLLKREHDRFRKILNVIFFAMGVFCFLLGWYSPAFFLLTFGLWLNVYR